MTGKRERGREGEDAGREDERERESLRQESEMNGWEWRAPTRKEIREGTRVTEKKEGSGEVKSDVREN